MARVRSALVDLVANALRVTRGAGKSGDLGQQACEFLQALNEYEEVAGFYPGSWNLDNALSIQREPSAQLSVDELVERAAETVILQGALQVVASRMLGQRTFESKGQNELYDGIRQLDEHRKERRKRLKEEW
jgi:hypothetical protein